MDPWIHGSAAGAAARAAAGAAAGAAASGAINTVCTYHVDIGGAKRPSYSYVMSTYRSSSTSSRSMDPWIRIFYYEPYFLL